MVVLGSRHLSRTEEFLSAGSLVVPVAAQARCPVAVVGDAEHSTQDPPYLVVGVDGSASFRAALALAFEEADLRRCALRAIAVWAPPVFTLHTGDTLFHAERRMLSETTAGWAEKYPTSGSPTRSSSARPSRPLRTQPSTPWPSSSAAVAGADTRECASAPSSTGSCTAPTAR